MQYSISIYCTDWAKDWFAYFLYFEVEFYS